MILPKGITGFRSIKDGELQLVDAVQFKQLCYSVFREAGGVIKDFDNLLSHRNFYLMEGLYRGEPLLALLNAYHPFVAFANSIDDISFIEVPELAVKFSPYYNILNKKQLEQPLTKAYLSNLSKTELEQISYWKPEKIGGVVFNLWD